MFLTGVGSYSAGITPASRELPVNSNLLCEPLRERASIRGDVPDKGVSWRARIT